MKDFSSTFPVKKMASILGVACSGYYAFQGRPASRRAHANQELIKKIRHIHEQNHATYGSSRIHAELRERGETCSRPRVARLMRTAGIRAKMTKRFKCTTHQDGNPPFIAPDLMRQDFKADTPNEAWVSDITYIATHEGWVYCAVILDLFSRRVVGLAVEAHMRASLVIAALSQALTHRRPQPGIFHHSDRGSQYTSTAMKILAEDYGVQLSMGRVANAYDNAVAESFFHTLKTELVAFRCYQNLEEAKMSIFRYVYGFYNQKRRHSTLGYVSPATFETQFYQKGLAAF